MVLTFHAYISSFLETKGYFHRNYTCVYPLSCSSLVLGVGTRLLMHGFSPIGELFVCPVRVCASHSTHSRWLFSCVLLIENDLISETNLVAWAGGDAQAGATIGVYPSGSSAMGRTIVATAVTNSRKTVQNATARPNFSVKTEDACQSEYNLVFQNGLPL